MPGWDLVMVQLVGGPFDGQTREVVRGSRFVQVTDRDGGPATYRAAGEWAADPPPFHYDDSGDDRRQLALAVA